MKKKKERKESKLRSVDATQSGKGLVYLDAGGAEVVD